MDLVSVVIPVYNAEKYLHECLDSVINQTLKDIEIICVNDASTDDSLAILEEYAIRDERITILNNEINLHGGVSRNRGIEVAKGEYIHFLDADDFLVSDAYETLYYKAKADNLDMLKFKAILFDVKTKKQIPGPWCQLSLLIPEDYNIITDFYEKPEKFLSAPDTAWSGIYKRSFLLEKNLLFNDLQCTDDHSFYISVILKAKSVMFIDYNILYYRVNISDSSTAILPKHFDCQLKSFYIVKELCETLQYDLKNLILCKEINGIFSQLISFQNKRVLNSETYEQTKAFFRDLDVSAFEKKYGFCHWCKQYVLQNSFSSFKLKGKLGLDTFIKQIYRFVALCKNEGLKYALRKTKTILFGRKA